MEGVKMTIETKFIIGLLLLMIIGSMLAGFMGAESTAFNSFSGKVTNFMDSFDNFTYKSIGNVLYQGGAFLIGLLVFMGQCVFWNFPFFDGFEWLRVILIMINIAILIKIMVDIFRSLKPFGS
jgi:hypothetical protein